MVVGRGTPSALTDTVTPNPPSRHPFHPGWMSNSPQGTRAPRSLRHDAVLRTDSRPRPDPFECRRCHGDSSEDQRVLEPGIKCRSREPSTTSVERACVRRTGGGENREVEHVEGRGSTSVCRVRGSRPLTGISPSCLSPFWSPSRVLL